MVGGKKKNFTTAICNVRTSAANTGYTVPAESDKLSRFNSDQDAAQSEGTGQDGEPLGPTDTVMKGTGAPGDGQNEAPQNEAPPTPALIS